MRQIFPDEAGLADADLAALYAYPDLTAAGPPTAAGSSHWLRANMVTSMDGAATLLGRSGGLSSEWDQQVFAMLRALTDVILVGAGTVRAEHYGPVRRNPRGCAGPG